MCIRDSPEIRLRPDADLADLLHEFAHHVLWVEKGIYWASSPEERAEIEIKAWNWAGRKIKEWLKVWKEDV